MARRMSPLELCSTPDGILGLNKGEHLAGLEDGQDGSVTSMYMGLEYGWYYTCHPGFVEKLWIRCLDYPTPPNGGIGELVWTLPV